MANSDSDVRDTTTYSDDTQTEGTVIRKHSMCGVLDQ